jgi:hypothetical protein
MRTSCSKLTDPQGRSTRFNCDRLRADLSTTACARMYLDKGALSCDNCPRGKVHAAKHYPKKKSVERINRWGSCARCERQGLRLVCCNCLCVSCYNRQREVRVGANAKGQNPVLWRGRLRPGHIRFSTRQIDLELCVSVEEIKRIAARRWPDEIPVDIWLDDELPQPQQDASRPIR